MAPHTTQGFLGLRLWQAGIMLVMGCLLLAGCAGGAGSSTVLTGKGHTPIPGTPVPTSTPDLFGSPTPEPTAGLPCKGGIWGNILQFAQAGIPLPPLTVSGAAENFQSGNWTGFYLSLCTGGNIDSINSFTSTHMSELGWSYVAPPGDCLCNGDYVWTKQGDARMVQFEPHPAQYNGQVRWGVSIFTH